MGSGTPEISPLKIPPQTRFRGVFGGFPAYWRAKPTVFAPDWHSGCIARPYLGDLWEIARFSGRCDVKSAVSKILMSAIILSILAASAALAQKQDLQFHWGASPVIEGDGIVRPEAVSYEVWLKRGNESSQMLTTVSDTTFWLTIEPGVSHRIQVRGLDNEGRKSKMSELSDPVYLEMDGDITSFPYGAQLKANYPNPFNPETRIVYGVPEGIKSSDPVRLEIFTLQGHRVRTLDVDRSPGWHEVSWDGRDQRGMVTSAGMYVTRFVVGTSIKTGKMTMVK
jgi:hypothetical protein